MLALLDTQVDTGPAAGSLFTFALPTPHSLRKQSRFTVSSLALIMGL